MKIKELNEKSRADLLAFAARLKLTGRHRMNKEELAAGIAKAAQKKALPRKGRLKADAGAATAAKTKAAARIKASTRAKTTTKAKKQTTIKDTAAQKTKKAQTIKKPRAGRAVSAPAAQREKMPDTPWQEDVERAKYELFTVPVPPGAASLQELPREYGETGITILVRDPYRAYAYWELEPHKLKQAQQAIGAGARGARIVLRVYDITGIEFTGTNAHHSFDITVTARTGSWYLSLGAADRTYCVDIGLMTARGVFHMLARSASVHTPRARMSDVIDEKHAASKEQFEKIYALSGGHGFAPGSLELQEMAAQRLKELVSSPGMSSGVLRKK